MPDIVDRIEDLIETAYGSISELLDLVRFHRDLVRAEVGILAQFVEGLPYLLVKFVGVDLKRIAKELIRQAAPAQIEGALAASGTSRPLFLRVPSALPHLIIRHA